MKTKKRSTKKTKTTFTLKETLPLAMNEIKERFERKENITGIPSGFHDLDIMTAGFKKGQLIILGGRPSMGKTAFATSIMEYVALAERIPCAYFSFEMSKELLAQRLLTSISGVNGHKIRTGFFSKKDWPKLEKAQSELSEAPIYIDDYFPLKPSELKSRMKRLKVEHNVQFFIIDHLQSMERPVTPDMRHETFTITVRSLKRIARALDITILLLSQISSDVELRADFRPRLRDLDQYGEIEQNADMVLFLLREEYYYPTEKNKGLTEVMVSKQRSGPVGVVNLSFSGDILKFNNLSTFE